MIQQSHSYIFIQRNTSTVMFTETLFIIVQNCGKRKWTKYITNVYNEKLINNLKEGQIDACNKMNESQKLYAKWKNKDTKCFILCDSIYMSSTKKKKRQKIYSCQCPRFKWRDGLKWGIRKIFHNWLWW